MRRLFRHRLLLLWMLLAIAACAVALVFHRLYSTARDEIAAQSAAAIEQEKARAVALVSRYAEEVRQTTVAALAGFHVDGLERTLARWDEANDIVVGTFVWDPRRGGLSVAAPAGALSGPELEKLVGRFREWRASHREVEAAPALACEHFRTMCYRLDGNPQFDADALGYQAENLELLAEAGGVPDPWAGWAGSLQEPAAAWVFWYQTGPEAPVRGCFVDVVPLVQRLQAELAAGGKARVRLEPWIQTGVDQGRAGAGLPGYRLVVGAGEELRTKAGDNRAVGLVGALLLGLFLGVGVLVTVFARRSAREAERRLTFVAQVSHELRTPLTSIRMFADLLGGDAVDDAKRQRFAARIGDESRRLGGLIERLLAFNVLEKGVKRVECSAVAVGEVIDEVAEEMRDTLVGAGLALEVALPTDSPVARTDRSALKQALINLLDNAVKYASGSGELGLTVAVRGETVSLTVADRGPGIPREIRAKVFDAFVQGGRTMTDKTPGLGLGLGIARGLLRQAGGDLVLLSSEQGATFEIQLPVEPAKPVSAP